MKFKSRKGIIIQLTSFIFCGMSSFIIYQIFTKGIENYEFVVSEIFLFLLTLYLLWLYFGTEYKLTQTELIYKSGILNGRINIENINEIVTNENVWAGIRPALAINGMLVKFNKYDDIFISVKNEKDFIKKILEINNGIKITRN